VLLANDLYSMYVATNVYRKSLVYHILMEISMYDKPKPKLQNEKTLLKVTNDATAAHISDLMLVSKQIAYYHSNILRL
jgi:hypothetical protein